jgi:hypothetical protein
VQPVGVASARVPTSVTALGVTAIVFASLGFLGSAWGVLGLVIQRRSVDMMREMGASNPDPATAGVVESMLSLQEQIFWPTAATHVLFGLAAVAIGAAGVVVLIRNRHTPSLAPALFALTAALAVLGTGGEVYIQHAMFAGMRDMMTGVMSGAPSASAEPMMDQMLGLQQALGYGCAGGWLLIKLSFLMWAALHLRSPEIAALFGGPVVLGARGD